MRGAGMRNRADQVALQHAQRSLQAFARDAARDVLQRKMGGGERDAHAAAHQHHHHVRGGGALGEKFGMAGERDAGSR